MLEILYGTNPRNTSNAAYRRIEQTAAEGKTAWLLVPEQFSLSAENLVIKSFGVSAQRNIKVITFSRLCNLVLSKLGPLRLKYIDGAGKQIIAAAAVRDVKSQMTSLAAAVRRRGFASDVVSLVSEFKRYGVSAPQLEEAADKTDSDELSAKLKDISVILDTFNKRMADKAADAEDNLSIICHKIHEFGFRNGCLYIMHFRSFTPVEYNAIGELMKCLDVCAVMCCDSIYKCSPLFSPVAASCRCLAELAQAAGIACAEPELIPDTEEDSALSYLQHSYFAQSPSPYGKSPENIEIFEVSNHYREAEAAADLILRLCRTEGRRFSDFLILARDTETYSRIIPPVFASRGIDVFLDARRSILTKPLPEMLCAVLDILAGGYSYERVMLIARSGMTFADDEDIDIFENYVLAVDPTHAMWSEDEWHYELSEFDLECVNRVRKQICSFPERLGAMLSGRKCAAEISEAILKCLQAEKTAERVNAMCAEFVKNGMPYLADEYRGIWNSIISVLSQISVLMDKEPISRRDFADLFRTACSGISVGITPGTQGSATFAGIDRFRSDSVPIVIVLGMTDGVFPRVHASEGLISDAEREKLSSLGITLAPGIDAKCREEQLLIYSVLTAPSERLYLFTPLSDTDGKPLRQSPIIRNICGKLFPELAPYNPDGGGDILRGGEGRAAAFDALCTVLSACGGKYENLSGTAEVLYNYFEKDRTYTPRLKKVIASMTAPEPEKLTRAAAEAIYGSVISLSATKLEKYNDCAFSYFMRYGLLLSERTVGGLDSRDTGSIQHDALYHYFTELVENKTDYSGITKEECFKRVGELVREAAQSKSELLYESSFYFKYIVTRMQSIAARCAWETVKFYRSGRFRPYGCEIRIGTDGEIPSVEINNSEGAEIARMTGFIDRADIAVLDGKTYVSIIDYKSSKTELEDRLAEAGVKIQPLFYSDVVCRRLNASPAAMMYMQMVDPIIHAEDLKSDDSSEIERNFNKNISFGGWINSDDAVLANYQNGENGEKFLPSKKYLLPEDEINRRIACANEKIREAAEGIYSGNIAAEPFICKDHSACTYCPFGLSCGRAT